MPTVCDAGVVRILTAADLPGPNDFAHIPGVRFT